MDRNKLAKYLGWSTFIAVFLGLNLNGTAPIRWIHKHLGGYTIETKEDVNGDGLEDIILTKKDGSGLIFNKTGWYFPEYMQTGFIFSGGDKYTQDK